ncbi:DUF3347 domain-containing protein [Chitinophaga flava]|uniref:DUF3347 domain-containing protein n=1 Tax=Chitinophaga flava TaxID=2259036 RepID=A0A365XZV5_9BACT|nr:DUF3347 domain-containing protein [Chitinophaga flava]RBL91095.1 hypothetical protein DF182_00295 [Chitinophaga flava]
MTTFLKAGLSVMAAALLAACGNSKTAAPDKPDSSGQQSAPVTQAAKPAGLQLKDDQLNAVYLQYQQLSAALINGDEAAARIAANAIEAGAKGISGAEKLVSTAAGIMAAPHLDAQRTAYATLSNDLITLVKKSGISSGSLYIDYCPMALNDKGGYWLSNDSGIKNPYFGDKMLTCGEVKETIQ